MINVKVSRVSKADFPEGGKIRLKLKDWEDIGKLIVVGIQTNINNQQQADGSPIKSNAPSTLARKRKEGKEPKSLIDQFKRFVKRTTSSWFVSPSTESVTVYPSDYTGGDPSGATLRSLVRSVQARGYVGWFGISKRALSGIRLVVRNRIKAFFDDIRKFGGA